MIDVNNSGPHFDLAVDLAEALCTIGHQVIVNTKSDALLPPHGRGNTQTTCHAHKLIVWV